MNFEARMPEVAEDKRIINLPPLVAENPDNIAISSLRLKQKKFTALLCVTLAFAGICVLTLAAGLLNAAIGKPCFLWFTVAEITGAIGVYFGVKLYKIYELIDKEFDKASDYVKALKYKAETSFFHKLKVVTLILGIVSFSGIFLFLDFKAETLSLTCIAIFVICLFACPASWALESNYEHWYEYHRQEDKCEHCAYDSEVVGCEYNKKKCRIPDAKPEI